MIIVESSQLPFLVEFFRLLISIHHIRKILIHRLETEIEKKNDFRQKNHQNRFFPYFH